jgi:hypothetical protein
MANYNLITDGTPFADGVYSLVPAPLNAGAESHVVTLPPYFARDPENVEQVAWIIEACGISMDAADDLTVTVTDADANGPVLEQILAGATSTSWRILAGEWFPQGCTVTFATTTGTDIAIRLSARKDRGMGGQT